jgi:WD40 repeat protein
MTRHPSQDHKRGNRGSGRGSSCGDRPTGRGPPLNGHTSSIVSVALGGVRGRHLIVSGSNDETVRVWDASTLELLVSYDLAGSVKAHALNDNSLRVAISSALHLFGRQGKDL